MRIEIADGRVVCESAVLADRPLARMRGLLGRRTLPPGEGLLLEPASSVHTAFMRFPIDAVFLGRDGRVLRVAPDLNRGGRPVAAEPAPFSSSLPGSPNGAASDPATESS